MKPGPLLRRMFGPAEHHVTAAYRRFFIDLRDFALQLSSFLPVAKIVDIGCGEGQSTEFIARAFTSASIVGVDITSRVGRLFRGDAQRVTFVQQEFKQFASQHRCAFDLAVVCDVCHHVAPEDRQGFLQDAVTCLRQDGWLVVKEWEARMGLAHLLCYLSDRFITGDKVQYATHGDLRKLVGSLDGIRLDRETRVAPWLNNIALWAQVSQFLPSHATDRSAGDA